MPRKVYPWLCPACKTAYPPGVYDSRRSHNEPCPNCGSTERAVKDKPVVRPLKVVPTKKPKVELNNTSGVGEVKKDSSPYKEKKEDISELPLVYDFKGKLTDKEYKYLEFYMTGEYTVEEAMILAGYENHGVHYRKVLARKIIVKHECQTDDHRKIFRAIGAGELAIAQGLLDLARHAKSEMVRLNAWSTLAKCLGLTKEIVEGVEGIQIVINSSRGLPKPGEPPKDLPPSSGALQITK